jgi:hypothetical protein
MKGTTSSIIIIAVLVGVAAAVFILTSLSSLQRSFEGFQHKSENPFVSGSEELKSCMRGIIGDKAFEEIAQNKRRPTDSEGRELETCFKLKRDREQKTPEPTKEYQNQSEAEKQREALAIKNQSESETLAESETQEEKLPIYGDPWNPVLVTFEVKVPEWTPKEDKIYLVVDGYMPETDWGLSRGIPMKEKEPNVWSVIFKSPPQTLIKYKYNRDNVGYETDEEFSPDSPDTWRKIFVEDENLSVKEKIKKWRWLSAEPPQVTLSTFVPTDLPKRDEPFIVGISLLDFFDPKFKEHVSATLDKIKEGGFGYVGIATSASTFISSKPLKFTRNKTNYEFIEYVITEAHKRGLKVLLSAGIETGSTATLSFEEIEAEFQKPQNDEWYLQLVEEWKSSMVEMAKFAQKNNVEIFTPADQWFVWGIKTEEQKRMLNNLINDAYVEIRKVYSGKISSDHYDSDKAFDYYKQLDWIGDKWWWGLTDKKDAALQELKEGAEKIVREDYRPIYEKYQKPILLQQVAYASYDGAAGASQISTEDPRIAEWYPYNNEIPLDLQEQADAYEAVFQAIYDEPIFVGAFSFSYTYWDHQDKSTGIRGKPAEDVWVKWNNLFTKNE